jgi:predicted RNA-binding protein YlxR (DUF448 family)
MCVGCRARAAQSDLLRLAVDGSFVTPDTAARMPGRGAYLHADPGCAEAAARRRVWPKAFRVRARLDTSRVDAFFADV